MVKSQDSRQFIQAHRMDDVRTLMLQADRFPKVDMRSVCVQIAAWQRARTKLPSWAACSDIIFPEHLPMEQCSSELTAKYKRQVARAKDEELRELLTFDTRHSTTNICDLTGGFGVDATMLAQGDVHLTFVERNENLCELARHNLPLMGVEDVEIVCGEAEKVLPTLSHQNLIYLDPARRDQYGSRIVALTDCSPNVEQMQDLLLTRAACVMVKLSPMLDVADTLRRLRHVREVHVVSVEGECKEILLLLSATSTLQSEQLPIICVNLSERIARQTFSFTREEEQSAVCPFATEIQNYIYEPNSSLLKAGALRSVAERFGLRKLHPNSHLYTSEMFVEDFPGRSFEVVSSSDFNKKNRERLLNGLRQANLTVRNFPLTVVELRRRLKLCEGGSDYLFATTLTGEKHILVRCRKLFQVGVTIKP